MTTIDPAALQGKLSVLYSQAVVNNERPVDVRNDITTAFTRYLHGERTAGRITGFGLHCNHTDLSVRVSIWASRNIRWNLDFPPRSA